MFTCQIGWALTLLSDENLSYASTCQTIGLNTGYFASYTVFLALNSEAFRYVPVVIVSMPTVLLIRRIASMKWGIPQLTLSAHLRFWSVICFCVTIWLTFFQKEVGIYPAQDRAVDPPISQRKEVFKGEDTSITGVYKTIWSIVKLKRRPLGHPQPHCLLTRSRCPIFPFYTPIR